MRRPRPSTLAWMAVPVAVAAYDWNCPEGEQMSERCDEWMEDPVRRALLIGSIGAVALHLINVAPERWDIIHHMASFRRKSPNG